MNTSLNDTQDFTLYIHNGGNAPCVELKFDYPEYFVPYLIMSYDVSNLQNAELRNGSLAYSPQYAIPLSCPKNICELGYIKENEIIPITFVYRKSLSNITNFPQFAEFGVSCSGQVKVKVISIK